MNPKSIVIALALAGLAGLGWYAYTVQRSPSGTGFEVKGPGAAPAAGAPGAGGGQGAPAGGPAAGAQGAGGPGGGVGPGGAGGPGAAGGPGGPGGRPAGPTGVEIAKVDTRAIAEEAAAVGTLRANESVILRSEVAGRIEKVAFTDGQRVKRGTVLIALDASITAAELEQARAELALARANFERTSELAQRNFVSAAARDQAAANLKVQEAKVRLAEARLAKAEIRAPFDGVVGLRNVSPGDFVKDGADLVALEDIARMKVDLRLPERFFGRVKPGLPVQVSFDSLPGKTFVATLTAIDAQVDANGRSLLARGTMANPDGALRGGMFARARVVLRENPDAMTIPEEAIVAQGNDALVWKVVDGKAQRTKVVTGMRRDGRVEVLSGLAVGDAVVTAGQLRLQRDGQEVRVVDPNRRPAGPPGAGTGGGPGSVQGPREGGPQAGAPGAAPAGGPPSAAPGTGAAAERGAPAAAAGRPGVAIAATPPAADPARAR